MNNRSIRTRLTWAFLPSALFAGVAPVASGEPPSSIAPPKTLAKVRIAYQHSLTEGCTGERQGDGRLVCRPRLVPLTRETSVSLVPVKRALVLGHGDQRQPISKLVESHAVEAFTDVELTPGRWRLAWPGYDRQPVLQARSSDTLEVRLSAVDGRCEASSSECRVVPAPTRRSVDVSRHD